MNRTLGAHTQLDGYRSYPSFFNVSLEGDDVVLTIRPAEKPYDGAYLCGFAADKGQPDRCTPGDDRCNNYCNMVPGGPPMPDHPMPYSGAHCGEIVSMRMPLEQWRRILRDLVVATPPDCCD